MYSIHFNLDLFLSKLNGRQLENACFIFILPMDDILWVRGVSSGTAFSTLDINNTLNKSVNIHIRDNLTEIGFHRRCQRTGKS